MITPQGKEGVISEIIFPLQQDTLAISKAISNLLSEGWKFELLTATDIKLKRIWEVDITSQTQEQIRG